MELSLSLFLSLSLSLSLIEVRGSSFSEKDRLNVSFNSFEFIFAWIFHPSKSSIVTNFVYSFSNLLVKQILRVK